MKHFFLFLMMLTTVGVNAQVTESQKKEALSAASQFCSLLSQFSNGGVQYIGNDQKIFALCSSRNISAFDDIQENKEVLLSSYLSLITKKYKNNVQFKFSQPVYFESFRIPDFSMQIVHAIQNNGLGGTPAGFDVQLRVNEYTDVYIIINVTQTIPTLGKTTMRKLIYSVNSHKIISFSNNQSPYLLMQKGLVEMSNKNFKESINYFRQAISYPRFNDKQACYAGMVIAEAYLGNIDAAIDWLEKSDIPIKRGFIAYFKGSKALGEEDYKTAYDFYKIAADEGVEYAYYALGLFYGSDFFEGVCEQNEELAKFYLKKAANSKTDVIVRTLGSYWLCCLADDGEIKVSEEEYQTYALICVKEGYKQIYLHLYQHYNMLKQYDQCYHWASIAAKNGDRNGMALAGFYAIFAKKDRREGVDWLKKSIDGKTLEKSKQELEEDEGSAYLELSSTEEVKELIRLTEKNQEKDFRPKYNYSLRDLLKNNNSNSSDNNAYMQWNQSGNNQSYSNVNNSQVSNGVSSSNLNNSNYGYSHSFNAPCDNYFWGLSVGYVQKQWTIDSKNGKTEKCGFWDDSSQISGVQVGVRVNPQFIYGLGLNTGLYYEYYYSKSNPMNYTDDYGQYTGTLQEHALYLPIHLEYRLNISEYFQLFLYGGLGIDYGLANSIKWVDCDDDSYSDSVSDIYDSEYSPDWQRFNYSLEYGGGIRSSRFQLNFTISKGLKNMSNSNDYKMHQGKNLMLSLSVML